MDKADAPPVKPQSAMTVAYDIDKVSKVSLPKGWSWADADKDKALTEKRTVTATAEYTADDRDYYTGGLTATVKITRQKRPTISIERATISGVTEKTYNGKAQTQNPIVSLKGMTLKNGTDYTLSYKNNVNAGTATMVITGRGDYEGSKYVTFRILSAAQAKKMANAVVTGIDPAGYKYKGKAIKPRITVYIGGKRLADKKDYTLSYKNNTKAGTATITIKAKGKNYKESKKVTFKINKIANPLKAVGKTATIKLKNVSKKKQTLNVGKIIKITRKGKGKLTYSKSSGDKRITIAAKTGKVTVAKGTPAGNYKIMVKVKAAGDSNHKSGTSTATAYVKIKQ